MSREARQLDTEKVERIPQADSSPFDLYISQPSFTWTLRTFLPCSVFTLVEEPPLFFFLRDIGYGEGSARTSFFSSVKKRKSEERSFCWLLSSLSFAQQIFAYELPELLMDASNIQYLLYLIPMNGSQAIDTMSLESGINRIFIWMPHTRWKFARNQNTRAIAAR